MASNGAPTYQPTRQALAWSVHLFTASGAVLAVFALWEIGRGGFARAAIYLLAALAIDSVDGTLARRVGVAERLPRIDGRTLDDVVDYLNYAIVPVVFLLALGSFVHWSVAVLPVIASCYGFAQVDAKTEDDFFLGWPSYWNVVAFYVWLLDLSPAAASAWVALFSALIFVPLKYIYPSKLRRLRGVTAVGGTLWVIAMALIAGMPPTARRECAAELSLVFPAYYVALSAWLGEWWPLRTQVSRSEPKASEDHRNGP
jgi:phosphatidylcholine synthase